MRLIPFLVFLIITVASCNNSGSEKQLKQEQQSNQLQEKQTPYKDTVRKEPTGIPDTIRIEHPLANDTITSPVTVRGAARGNWFFEASFPIVLMNKDSTVIAHSNAQAQGEWMTADFVPFQATLEFDTDQTSGLAYLVFEKANPSGLPEHASSYYLPVFIAGSTD